MLILDTDLLTLVQRRSGAAYGRLNDRLERASATEVVCVTIISFEEQARGWLAYLARSRTDEQQIDAYGRLHQLLTDFSVRHVLDFDAPASRILRELVQSKVRLGKMDLKIAAIAMSQDATLLSSNLRDFRMVPKLRVEDWTLA